MAVQQLHSQTQLQEAFPFREISKKSISRLGQKSLQEVLSDGGMIEVVGRAGFGFPNFPESKKVFQVVYFKLTEEFKEKQPLFSGLISIGQPSKGAVEFYPELDTFAIKYYQSDEAETVSYLENILSVLKEEIRFKQILKRVIENQERFGKESQLLHQELFAGA